MGHLLQHLADVSQQQLEVQRNVQQQLQYVTHGARLLQEQLVACASAAGAEAVTVVVPPDGHQQPDPVVPENQPCFPCCPAWMQQFCRCCCCLGKSCAACAGGCCKLCGKFGKCFKRLSVFLPLLIAVAGICVLIFVLVTIAATPF
jgi:hypothetical protein